MDKPLISVITVSYNAMDTIEETILSVINQTYSRIEYIIIDGGSTDGTLDIIKKYDDQISFWVSEPDKGIYDAMNKGILASKGDFLFFLGADDIIITEFSSVIHNFTSRQIFYGMIKQKSDGQVVSAHFNRFSLVRKNIPHQAIFYPRNVFDHLTYNLKYKLYADWLLNIQCFSLKIPCRYIGQLIVLYNDCGLSGKQHDDIFIKEFGSIIRQYLGVIPFISWLLVSFVRKIKILCF